MVAQPIMLLLIKCFVLLGNGTCSRSNVQQMVQVVVMGQVDCNSNNKRSSEGDLFLMGKTCFPHKNLLSTDSVWS